jgi:rhodanese-related sulfurtransferase
MRKLFIITLALVLAACGPKIIPPTEQSLGEPGGYRMISVDELSQALKTKDFLFVNVHIPLEGNIPETDLDIPYNEIEKQINKFPADKDAKIVLYCRSGSMGNTAAQSLADLGYTNVFNLEGGYNAWKAAGNQFLEKE